MLCNKRIKKAVVGLVFACAMLGVSALQAADTKPVEFTPIGVKAGTPGFNFSIKITTDKPVTQVDIGMKFLDATGKVVDQTPYIWENIVKSVRQPIEQGKTYEDNSPLLSGATKAEATLLRVHFKDRTVWTADAK
ncbi:MAG: hypothetical protein V2A66_11135 [Pseudomonadota bacterium]